MLQWRQGKLVLRLVLNAKCLTPVRNYHTRQSEVEHRLAFRNNLHIASIKQFHKESVNWLICLSYKSSRRDGLFDRKRGRQSGQRDKQT